MILPDVNVPVYAYNPDARNHKAAKLWWEDAVSSGHSIGLAWAVVLGFIRLTTSKSVMMEPIAVAAVVDVVREWLAQPSVTILNPGPEHAKELSSTLAELGTGGNLTADAHLASLVIEFRGDLVSNDADFACIQGLRWTRPF